MMRSSIRWSMSIAVAAVALSATLAFAIPGEDHEFLDREALADTLTVEEKAALVVAEKELAEAQKVFLKAEEDLDKAIAAEEMRKKELMDAEKALQDAIDAGADPGVIEDLKEDVKTAAAALALAEKKTIAAQGLFDAAKKDRDAKAAVVLAINEEIEKTGKLVGELSDAQVFAMNRNLNSAIASGLLPLGINSEDLEKILAEEYDKVRINAFVTAFKQRAMFERHALHFEEKADDTGDSRFQDKADAMRDRGERQFDKFQEKADAIGARAAAAEARAAAREEAKEESKNAMAEERRKGARGEAKGQGHD